VAVAALSREPTIGWRRGWVWTAMALLFGDGILLSPPSYGGFEGAYRCGCCG
jgi:hypothetical protein